MPADQVPPPDGHPPVPGQLRDGVAIVDKAAGWTSHDVVAKARGILQNKKIGHSGTLDPDATGVLVLGVGRATRLLRFLNELPKSYEGEVVLGVETDTLDASGKVTATHDMVGITAAQVRNAAARLTGEVMQVPPMVSAVRIGGKRLYELARAGKVVEREARPIRVDRFTIEPVAGEAGVFRARVDCSSGTYVRSLAADLGAALGGGAHLRSLRRTAIGSFTLVDARSLDAVEVLPPAAAMRDFPFVVADADVASAVSFGRLLPCAALGERRRMQPEGSPGAGSLDDGPWAVLDQSGALLAVYQRHKGEFAKPAVVLVPAAS